MWWSLSASDSCMHQAAGHQAAKHQPGFAAPNHAQVSMNPPMLGCAVRLDVAVMATRLETSRMSMSRFILDLIIEKRLWCWREQLACGSSYGQVYCQVYLTVTNTL